MVPQVFRLHYIQQEPISGNDLITEGIEGARRLGAEIVTDEVLGISYGDKLTVITKSGEYEAVLGDGSYALHEALELLPTLNTVTIHTNGKEPDFQVPQNIIVNTSIIDSIRGNNAVEEVHCHIQIFSP